MCVLHDMLSVIKEKKYMALDPVSQDSIVVKVRKYATVYFLSFLFYVFYLGTG